MAITRAQVEAILIRRCGALLVDAELDGVTVDGTNVDLNDPIGYSIRQCGGSVINVALVVDADLAAVSVDDYDKLLDVAELRTLESILGNLNMVDITVGPRKESLSDLGNRIEKKLARLQEYTAKKYGVGAGTISGGVIDLNFMQRDDE